MRKIHLDFETRSTVDIKKTGAWAYAMHPSTEVLCLAVALHGEGPRLMKGAGTGPVHFDALDVRRPATFLATADAVLMAHNAHFEYAVYNFILHKRYGWPAIWDPKRWGCTLARAAMCNLPISLENCAHALKVPTPKDKDGRAAMHELCKPRGYDALGDPIWNESPATLERLYKYCMGDVQTEMEIDERLPEMPPAERAVWEADLLINLRGVQTDVALAKNAAVMAGELTETLNRKLTVLTNGAVSKASRIQEMKNYLDRLGVHTPSLDKDSVNALLASPEVPLTVKDVLSIRRQVGKSSTAKYKAVLECASPADGRVRGSIQYHAAGTGRFGGRLVQPQNLVKGPWKPEVYAAEQEHVIDAIMRGDPELFSIMYGDAAMDNLSWALRGMFTATPGNKLVVVDYSSIESRVVLWLADDRLALGKIKMGINLYIDMARGIYRNEKITKKDTKEYAVGKATILGCGYGMGADRFQAECAKNGIHLTLDEAKGIIKAYRDKYRTVVNMWYATDSAARAAVRTPGTQHVGCGGRVVWGMDKKREFLLCRLPSGRCLRYFKPRVQTIPTPIGDKETLFYSCAGLGGALEEYKTYGGSLVENITQAVARDLMTNGLLKCEAAGIPVVLHSHDELVCDSAKGSVEDVVKLMCDTPSWAAGCPVAAEGWEGTRYRK